MPIFPYSYHTWCEYLLSMSYLALFCIPLFFRMSNMNRRSSPYQNNRSPPFQNNQYGSRWGQPRPPCGECGIQGHHANHCPKEEILKQAAKKSKKKKRKYHQWKSDTSSSSSGSSSDTSSDDKARSSSSKHVKKKSRKSRNEIDQAKAFSHKYPGRIKELMAQDAENKKKEKVQKQVNMLSVAWAAQMGLKPPILNDTSSVASSDSLSNNDNIRTTETKNPAQELKATVSEQVTKLLPTLLQDHGFTLSQQQEQRQRQPDLVTPTLPSPELALIQDQLKEIQSQRDYDAMRITFRQDAARRESALEERFRAKISTLEGKLIELSPPNPRFNDPTTPNPFPPPTWRPWFNGPPPQMQQPLQFPPGHLFSPPPARPVPNLTAVVNESPAAPHEKQKTNQDLALPAPTVLEQQVVPPILPNMDLRSPLSWTQTQEDEVIQLRGIIEEMQKTEKPRGPPTPLFISLRERFIALTTQRHGAKNQVRLARVILNASDEIDTPPGRDALSEPHIPVFLESQHTSPLPSGPLRTQIRRPSLPSPVALASDSGSHVTVSSAEDSKEEDDLQERKQLEDSEGVEALPQRPRRKRRSPNQIAAQDQALDAAASPSTRAVRRLRRQYVDSLQLSKDNRTSGRKWDTDKMRSECERLGVEFRTGQLKKLAHKLAQRVH